ncbi:MAG: hypothetical protein P4L92_22845 [Rudaea sp.]|nr:hypothetical protein [Rudaea sp.]
MKMISTAIRLVAARRLQKLGWAVVHYAQATERACLSPSKFREDMAQAWIGRVVDHFGAFIRARDASRAARSIQQPGVTK